jgi:signal transduction histidine kinase
MLLHSFGQDFKPWSEYGTTIRSELRRQSPWPLDIIDHPLVSARSAGDDTDAPFVEYLRTLFAKRPLDLIISVGAPAAAFVQRHRQQLFTNTPMILTAVDERRVGLSSLTANDAVVPVRIDYFSAIKNILQVLPDTDHVTIVVGTSPIEAFWKEAIAKEIAPLASRVEFSWTNELSFEQLLKKAASLPPRSAIFWELMIVDAAGVVHEGGAPLAKLHAAANAPIFSYDESFFGREIVGGPMLLVKDTSRETAAVAVRILGGERAGDIKTTPIQFSTPRFDWRELSRWGISEARLPPGSEIYFREPTVWEKYRWQIITVVLVFLLQAALITGLLYEHRRRRNAEVEARRRMAELAHMNRHATAGELSASIAHELNQPLGAILNNTEIAELLLGSASPPNLDEIREILAEIKRDDQRASEVIKRLRSLLTKAEAQAEEIDLNDTVREVFGFLSAQAASRNVALNSIFPAQVVRVIGDRIQLQQVILNLVVNGIDAMAETTARERRIVSRTVLVNGVAEVSIADCGPGIPSDELPHLFKPFFTTKEDGMGMGLSIARTIVEAHGGKISAGNQIDGGAIFRISLPVAKEH